MTFSKGLRSILRQDPDIILVGEVRDSRDRRARAEGRRMTGHLVLTTLHTNSAVAALTRLVDMGVEPFLVASSLTAAIAQRLVRTPCDACAAAYQPGRRARWPRSASRRPTSPGPPRPAAPAAPSAAAPATAAGPRSTRCSTSTPPMRQVLLKDATEAVGRAPRPGPSGMVTLRASARREGARGPDDLRGGRCASRTPTTPSAETCPACTRVRRTATWWPARGAPPASTAAGCRSCSRSSTRTGGSARGAAPPPPRIPRRRPTCRLPLPAGHGVARRAGPGRARRSPVQSVPVGAVGSGTDARRTRRCRTLHVRTRPGNGGAGGLPPPRCRCGAWPAAAEVPAARLAGSRTDGCPPQLAGSRSRAACRPAGRPRTRPPPAGESYPEQRPAAGGLSRAPTIEVWQHTAGTRVSLDAVRRRAGHRERPRDPPPRHRARHGQGRRDRRRRHRAGRRSS